MKAQKRIRELGPDLGELKKDMHGHAKVDVHADEQTGQLVEGSKIDHMDYAAKKRLADIYRPRREAEIEEGDRLRVELKMDERVEEARDNKAHDQKRATKEVSVGWNRSFEEGYEAIDWGG